MGTFEQDCMRCRRRRGTMFDTITRRRSDVATKNRVLTSFVAAWAHFAILTARVLGALWYFSPALPSPSEIRAVVAAPPLPPPPPPAAAPAPLGRARLKLALN